MTFEHHLFAYEDILWFVQPSCECRTSRFRGVTVSTQDSESCDPSSNLGGTYETFSEFEMHS